MIVCWPGLNDQAPGGTTDGELDSESGSELDSVSSDSDSASELELQR